MESQADKVTQEHQVQQVNKVIEVMMVHLDSKGSLDCQDKMDDQVNQVEMETLVNKDSQAFLDSLGHRETGVSRETQDSPVILVKTVVQEETDSLVMTASLDSLEMPVPVDLMDSPGHLVLLEPMAVRETEAHKDKTDNQAEMANQVRRVNLEEMVTLGHLAEMDQMVFQVKYLLITL